MAPLSLVPAGAGNVELARARGLRAHRPGVALAAPAGGLARRAAATPTRASRQKLQLAATLLSANLGTRVVTIDWGSFDTHGNQIQSQDPQLSTLSRALAAFKADLTARGIEGRVLTIVFSEFGRRVASNESGTDHGAGGLMMAIGSAVRGGLRGEFPGLTTLDRGDLRVTTDFRAVYSLGHLRVARRRPARGHPGRAVLPRGTADRVSRPGAHRGGCCSSPRWSWPRARWPRRASTGPSSPRPRRCRPRWRWTRASGSSCPRKRVVAAGEVTLRVYNRGEDDHDLSLRDATGAVRQVLPGPGRDGHLHRRRSRPASGSSTARSSPARPTPTRTSAWWRGCGPRPIPPAGAPSAGEQPGQRAEGHADVAPPRVPRPSTERAAAGRRRPTTRRAAPWSSAPGAWIRGSRCDIRESRCSRSPAASLTPIGDG